jgi:hypothetical protein
MKTFSAVLELSAYRQTDMAIVIGSFFKLLVRNATKRGDEKRAKVRERN